MQGLTAGWTDPAQTSRPYHSILSQISVNPPVAMRQFKAYEGDDGRADCIEFPNAGRAGMMFRTQRRFAWMLFDGVRRGRISRGR